MVDLIKLIEFARKYYYTSTEEYNSIGAYLTRVVYENGSISLSDSSINDIVEQNVIIQFKGLTGNSINLDFNYLPLEQSVEIKVNGKDYTDYTRMVDNIVLNNLSLVNVSSLNIRVIRYVDDTGIVYKGFEETKNYKPIFNDYYNRTVRLYYDNDDSLFNPTYHKWVLEESNTTPTDWLSYKRSYLKCSDRVSLDEVSLNTDKLIVKFDGNQPVTFTITRDEDDEYVYHPVKCSYNGDNTFTLKTI